MRNHASVLVCQLLPSTEISSLLKARCRAPAYLGRRPEGLIIQDISRAFLHSNDTPVFCADHIPYGGNHQSSVEREGVRFVRISVRFAIEEMTNIQMVVIRLFGRSNVRRFKGGSYAIH